MTEGARLSPAASLSIDLLNTLDVGILICSSDFETVHFKNDFFLQLPTDCTARILHDLRINLSQGVDNRHRQSVSCEDGQLLGFSAYTIDQFRSFVLCAPLSVRQYVSDHTNAYLFFDRLSTFIAEVVHEIGNPLSVITTTLEVLKYNQETWPQSKKAEYLDIALSELQRLSRYLQKIRDVSKPVQAAPSIITVNKHVEALHRRFNKQISELGIRINNRIPPALTLLADPDLFEQVLTNLYINAFDALDSPGGEIVLSAPVVIAGYTTLRFENNGPPIPVDLLEKIYTPFFTTKRKGAGIGLFTCKKLMTRMGGNIRNVPNLSRGVKFDLVFPSSDKQTSKK